MISGPECIPLIILRHTTITLVVNLLRFLPVKRLNLFATKFTDHAFPAGKAENMPPSAVLYRQSIMLYMEVTNCP